MVLQNSVLFGSVNANRHHYELAAQALAQADPGWLADLITRQVPLDRWAGCLHPQARRHQDHPEVPSLMRDRPDDPTEARPTMPTGLGR